MMPMPRSSIKWRMLSGEEPTKRLVRNPADLHRVVRDQPVAALNQLDGGLALADAAVAQQQDALAVDLHQHAVAGDARRQVHLQGGDHRRHKIAGRKTGAQQRNLIGVGRRHHLLGDVQVAADDDRRHLLGKELIQKLLPLLGGVLFHIGKLAQTEQLDSVAVEVIVKSAQLAVPGG